jgi:hypothetical protein
MLPMIVAQLGMVFALVHKRPGRYVAGLSAGILSFLAVSLALVPARGAFGASVAMLVSSVVLAVVMTLQERRKLAPGLKAALPAVALGLPFLVLVRLGDAPLTSALATVGFVGAYLGLLFAFRVLEPRELRDLYLAIRSTEAAGGGEAELSAPVRS